MNKKLSITAIIILYIITFNSCCTHEKETMNNNNCLTQKAFQETFKRVMMNPSITTLTMNKSEWKIKFSLEDDTKTLIFSKEGWKVGYITEDLEVLSTIKSYSKNEKMKKEIIEVFCRLNEKRK